MTADKHIEKLGDMTKNVQMDVAVQVWTDLLDVNRDNVFEFLATMGPELRAEFIAQVQAYSEEHPS